MSKLIVLKLGPGDLQQQGFPYITARLLECGGDRLCEVEVEGSLPPKPELAELLRRWQLLYRAFTQAPGRDVQNPSELPMRMVIDSTGETNISFVEFEQLCQELSDSFNAWLNSDSFRKIDKKIRIKIHETDEIRVIIQISNDLDSKNDILRRLPWHLWSLIEDYPKAAVALSAPEYERPLPRNVTKVKILAILGDSKGIDLNKDRKELQELPNADITLLVEPQSEQINDQLWNQHWDIISFSGHSRTEGETGRIYINPNESLSINYLSKALQTAVRNGLKLAIFNSCDGLGLAIALLGLHIPQVIVMAEPVPDRVAQAFLESFLKALSQGKSSDLAVRQARERLRILEEKFPCASWLPVLFQNPATPPLEWPSEPLPSASPRQQNAPRFLRRGILLAGAGLAFSLTVFLLGRSRSPNYNFKLRDELSYGEESVLSKLPSQPDKQQHFSQMKESECFPNFQARKYNEAYSCFNKALKEVWSNDPETVIYRNNAQALRQERDNQLKTYTLAVVVPRGMNEQEQNSGLEILRGVAQAQSEINQTLSENGWGLIILIANDFNNTEEAKQTAEKLVKQGNILGVIGHFSSEATKEASPIYKEGKLPFITATSTAVELAGSGNPYFNRVVPSDRETAKRLVQYIRKKLPQKTPPIAAVFYSEASSYSQSLKEEFINKFQSEFQAEKGRVRLVSHLNDNVYDADSAIKKATEQKVNVFVLLPDSSTRETALQVATSLNGSKNSLILGGDSLFNDTAVQWKANNLVVAVPWHCSQKAETQEICDRGKKDLWGHSTNSWRMGLAYKATHTFINVFQNLDKEPPTFFQTLSDFLPILSDNAERRQQVKNALQPFFENDGNLKTNQINITLLKVDCPSKSCSFIPIPD